MSFVHASFHGRNETQSKAKAHDSHGAIQRVLVPYTGEVNVILFLRSFLRLSFNLSPLRVHIQAAVTALALNL